MESSPSTLPPVTDLEVRRPGRPRNAGAQKAILEATLELTATCGTAGLSMDAVATRAGVSKASIYRRWASKEAMVLDAWQALVTPLTVPDTGTLRGDVETFLYDLAERMAASSGDSLPHLLAAARANPELACALQAYIQSRREPLTTLLRRARDRGELPDGLDLGLLQDCLVGPLMYRVLVSRAPVDRHFVDGVLALVLPRE